MPHTINDLVSSRNLSEAEVKATLAACGLSLEQGEYSDEDITSKFDVVRGLFTDGRVQAGDYQTAKELFATMTQVRSAKNRPSKATEPPTTTRQNHSRNQKSSPKTPVPFPTPAVNKEGDYSKAGNSADSSEETLTISDLMSLAKKYLDLDLTLKEVVNILELSGLPDKKHYHQQEANRFIIFCGLKCSTAAQGDNTAINGSISDTAAALESGLITLLNEVTQERAKEVPALVKQLYLQNVVMSLSENQEDIEAFFLQVKDGIIQGIEGKSPLRSILEARWIVTPLPESTSLLNRSLSISETGTSGELSS